MRTFKKVSTNPRLELTVREPWGYRFTHGKKPDAHIKATAELEKELQEAVKAATNLSKIVEAAVEHGDPLILDVSVSDYDSDLVTDTVYLLEDDTDTAQSKKWNEDFISALEWVMDEEIPYRPPLYVTTLSFKDGDPKKRSFNTFEELVEYYFTSGCVDYSCSELTIEEDAFMKKLQEYMLVYKLSGNKI